jgi:hypothetical protein
MIQHIAEDLLWSRLVAKAWCDEALMKRLLSEPRDVLAEHGMEAPDGMEVEVVVGEEVKAAADADGVRRFTISVGPPDELTDEDLIGGGPVAQCFSAVCAACAICGRCACRCACRCVVCRCV